MASSNSSGMQMVVFDRRRGNEEGKEDEKLLGFFPQSISSQDAVGTAGLLQGLVQFSASMAIGADTHQSHGDTQQQQDHFIENENSVWAMHEAEPDIFLALLASKAWLPRHVPQANLIAALNHTHNLMQLLFGGVRAALDEDDSSTTRTRSCIASVLNHVGRDLSNTSSWLHKELRNPFTTLGRLPSLQLPIELTLEVHSLCHRAELAAAPLIADIVIVWKGMILWSTLLPEDTTKVASLLATFILIPLEASEWAADGLGGASALAGKNMQRLPSGFIVLKEDFRTTEASHSLPFVYGTSKKLMHVLTYQRNDVVLLLLTADGQTEITEEALQTLRQVLEPAVTTLDAALEREIATQGHQLGHLPGWRYRVACSGATGVRASPRSKVSAMGHHSRSLTTAVLDSLDRIGRENIDEIVVRSSAGAWAAVSTPGNAAAAAAAAAAAEGAEAGDDTLLVRDRRLGGTAADCMDSLASTLHHLQISGS